MPSNVLRMRSLKVAAARATLVGHGAVLVPLVAGQLHPSRGRQPLGFNPTIPSPTLPYSNPYPIRFQMPAGHA